MNVSIVQVQVHSKRTKTEKILRSHSDIKTTLKYYAAVDLRKQKNKINETLEKVPELVLGSVLATTMAEQNQTLEIISRQVAMCLGASC